MAMAPDEALTRAWQALEWSGAGTVGWAGPGTVHGRMGAGMRSWGETVRLVVTPAPTGSWITVTSTSTVPFTLTDWGKNAANVRKLVALLDQWDAELHPRPQPS